MIGTFIGIDPSFGGFAVAAYWPDGRPARIERKTFPAARYGKDVDRLYWVGTWLDQIFEDIGGAYPARNVIHVTMEGYSRGSVNRREEAGELSAVTRLALRRCFGYPNYNPTMVAPKQRALFATGNGNSDKKEVMAACEQKWGQKFTNDNDADAYVLARMARDIHRGRSDLPYEEKVIEKLTPHPGYRVA